MTELQDFAQTHVVRRGIEEDSRAAADLLFLEQWELAPHSSVGAVLRIAQIRRANPHLAAAVRSALDPEGRKRNS